LKPLPGMMKRGPVWYYRDQANGKDRWRSLRTGRLTDARAKVLEMQGRPQPGDRVRVEVLARDWIEQRIRRPEHVDQREDGRRYRGRSAKGCRDAERRVATYLNGSELGRMFVDRVTARHLEDFRAHVETFKLAPATVAYILGDVRSMFGYAVGRYLATSPVPRGFLPKLEVPAPKPLAREELEAVCVLPGELGRVCRLLAGTGLRWSEAKRAQASDLHPIEVDGIRTLELSVPISKGGRPRRVPLAPEIAAELRGRVGRLMPYSSGSTMRKRVIKATGIAGFSVHRLRHSYACRLVDAGVPLNEIQRLLGHSTIKITERYASADQSTIRRNVLRAAAVATAVAPDTQAIAR